MATSSTSATLRDQLGQATIGGGGKDPREPGSFDPFQPYEKDSAKMTPAQKERRRQSKKLRRKQSRDLRQSSDAATTTSSKARTKPPLPQKWTGVDSEPEDFTTPRAALAKPARAPMQPTASEVALLQADTKKLRSIYSLPVTQTLIRWRASRGITGGNHHSYSEAMTAHIRGYLAATPCESCQRGGGPFLDCVLIDTSDLNSACTCCYWGGQGSRCTFHEPSRAPAVPQQHMMEGFALPVGRDYDNSLDILEVAERAALLTARLCNRARRLARNEPVSALAARGRGRHSSRSSARNTSSGSADQGDEDEVKEESE
ncbi:hypothetical protein HO173_012234 [Letharia columbiana]|uniref:Uncharacterized protein n=1 Tax=Letharia columbiana TaxID=112416 RepID=A0A8H6FH03_9LECA|nr:uncharacterized protein HO173_012234 [Letharia columbiana]KAF6227494.1 hypothetical protein HO173_012234 [Letharia columbiana]